LGTSPGPASPALRVLSLGGPVGEDKGNEPNWIEKGPFGLFGAHWAFTVGLAILILTAFIVTGFDIYIGATKGLALLDLTLEGQGEAVIAIITVIAGTYAALRFLTPGAKEPGH